MASPNVAFRMYKIRKGGEKDVAVILRHRNKILQYTF